MRRVLAIAAIQFCATGATHAAYRDVLTEFSTSVPGPSGLAWDGSHFWTCGNDGQIYKLASDGTIVNTIPMPDTGHMAAYRPDLAWDGTYLWFATYSLYNSERAVIQLSPEDGSVLRDLRTDWIERAGDDGFGLEYSRSRGTLILSQGSGYNRLIVIDALDGSLVETTPLPGWPRGGLALTHDSATQEIWVGGWRSQEQPAVAKIGVGSGYNHSVFGLGTPVSGLAWNGSNLVSIDAGGIVKMYDIALPCRPNIVTMEPNVDSFCQDQSPVFSWTAECTNTFTVEVSPRRDFREPVTSFEVGGATRVVMPDEVRDEFPFGKLVFWRVKGSVDGRPDLAKTSDVRPLWKYYDSFCWDDLKQ